VTLGERGKRGGPRSDDSGSRFLELVIVDWVSIGVAAFVLMGVWFGTMSFLAEHWPTLGAKLLKGSERGMYLWAIIVALSCIGSAIWRQSANTGGTGGSRR
jgi:hypothetical protein